MSGEDRDLGMGAAISRRDFVQGLTAGATTLAAAGGAAAATTGAAPGYSPPGAEIYPPLRTGMRGMHPGSFEQAHALRDGARPAAPTPTGETYDLVVVGAGLSGLSAAWFYRQKAGPTARILVLDNHDDFGGHARRNEFFYEGRTFVANGGSAFMHSPHEWRSEAIGMIDALGIDWRAGRVRTTAPAAAAALKPAVFFRQEIYGQDRLVKGALQRPDPAFLAQAPLTPQVKADLVRLMTGETDYLAGLTADEKVAKLRSISYRDYLLDVCKLSPEVLPFTQGVWYLGTDTASAWLAFFRGAPGFEGLGLRMPDESPDSEEVEKGNFTFPAGNSDIARLIVRSLIPDVLPAGTWQSIEARRADYAALDRPANPTRIRLSSTVVSARHLGGKLRPYDPDGREVEVAYAHAGGVYAVRAKNVIMAGMNNVVPYICPDMPARQKAALHAAVRAPNQSTTVLFRNWEAFARLGVSGVVYPATFYGSMRPSFGTGVGGLPVSREPSDPVVVNFGTGGNSGIASNPTMVSELLHGSPPAIGTPMDDQFRAIRAGLLQTPFAHFERAVRAQAASALSGGGFDPARDIVAITVNRWPHGFATGRNSLFDKVDPEDPISPPIIARQKFGRIAIANSDAAAMGTASAAIEQAARAVHDLETSNIGIFETY
jgi:spermidine dehydrogenase